MWSLSLTWNIYLFKNRNVNVISVFSSCCQELSCSDWFINKLTCCDCAVKSCNIIVTATGPQALELCFLNSFIDYKLDAFHICYLILIKICPKAILNSFGVAGVLSSWGGEHLQLIMSKSVPMETVFQPLLPRASSDLPEFWFQLGSKFIIRWEKGGPLWAKWRFRDFNWKTQRMACKVSDFEEITAPLNVSFFLIYKMKITTTLSMTYGSGSLRTWSLERWKRPSFWKLQNCTQAPPCGPACWEEVFLSTFWKSSGQSKQVPEVLEVVMG